MRSKNQLAMLLACVTALVPTATACNNQLSVKDPPAAETTTAAEESGLPEGCAFAVEFRYAPDGVYFAANSFFSEDTMLGMIAPEGARILYTTDGSEPEEGRAELYSEPILLEASDNDAPTVLVLKAKAIFSDGTASETATQTFFCAENLEHRFEMPVFSLSGEPAELTESPDGILYGKNYEQRGRESERAVCVEAFNSDGSILFCQDAGVRVFGAFSREAAVKSLKLFARRSYDAAYGKFPFDGFGTEGADGNVISKYDKLVLRSSGNDFQFAFVRDELNQRLAAKAGYTDCEAVLPAVVYLNGEYYGMLWLHEVFCDDLLKDKYGGSEGKYVVLEGTEQQKTVSETDPEEAMIAEAFNTTYQHLTALDLTDDANYAQVTEFMDVENYLQNYAFNIYINNADWPHNNFKCYRYFAVGGEALDSPQTDGRWRFLIHDTDYSLGIYEQEITRFRYNSLSEILNPESDRYAPMFAKLLEREDCRQYFLDEMVRLMDGALSQDSIIDTLDEMERSRYREMQYYHEVLAARKPYDSSIWTSYGEYTRRCNIIRMYARRRRAKMEEILIEVLKLPADYFSQETAAS